MRGAEASEHPWNVVFSVQPTRGQHRWNDQHTPRAIADDPCHRVFNRRLAKFAVPNDQPTYGKERSQYSRHLLKPHLVRIVASVPWP